ncbi:MAG: hypothetical protein ACR2G6_15465 [Gemmatimonadaceae bacterium]
MRLRYIPLAGLLIAQQAMGQGTQDAASLYEEGFLGSMVRQRFDRLGEMLVRAGDAASVANEAAIRNGLGGKAVLVDQLVFQLRQPGFNRSRVMAEAKKAASFCRQAQQAASLVAARVSGAGQATHRYVAWRAFTRGISPFLTA